MDIFATLKADHADIRSLVNEIINQTSEPISNKELALERFEDWPEDWEEALNDLKLSIVGHDRAEEAVLYTLLGEKELIEKKTREHHLIEEILESLEHINPHDRDWDDKLALLKNQIEAHQDEEEVSTFDRLRKSIDADTSSRLAHEFESLRDDIVEGAKYHPKGRSLINPAGLDLEG